MMENKNYVNIIRDYLTNRQRLPLIELFEDNRVVDMADVINELNTQEIIQVFKVLDTEKAAQLFTYMDEDRRQELVESFSGPQLKAMLNELYTDDIVDLMDQLPANLIKKILQFATPETRNDINLILSFPESSAGSIMSCDYFELKQFDTVDDAIAKLKKQGSLVETINTCFIIDEERHLMGSIQLKNLLFEKGNIRIKDIMQKDPVSVQTLDDQEEVAKVIRKYDITIVPVVNDENCLVGIITVDDIMDIMEEEITEDIHKMNAVAPMEESYRDASVMQIVKSRLPWLLILLLTNSINEIIIGKFESAIQVVPVLIGFIPMIMDTAGNGGGQSSAMVIRSIATGDVKTSDVIKVVWKEFSVAIFCSIVLFAITFARLYFFPSDTLATYGVMQVSLSVASSICLALIIGKTIGGLLPIIVKSLHFDPASVASPFISTLADTTSLIIYFKVASIFFKLG